VQLICSVTTMGGVLDSSLTESWEWRRSSGCNGGTCVEVAHRSDGIVVRSSADPQGAMLEFSHDNWRRLVSDVKDGLFYET